MQMCRPSSSRKKRQKRTYTHGEAVNYLLNLYPTDGAVAKDASKIESFEKYNSWTAVQFVKILQDMTSRFWDAFPEHQANSIFSGWMNVNVWDNMWMLGRYGLQCVFVDWHDMLITSCSWADARRILRERCSLDHHGKVILASGIEEEHKGAVVKMVKRDIL